MILLALLAALQASSPVQPVKPVVQNGEKSAVTDSPKTGKSQKPAPPITIGRPASTPQTQPQTQAGETPLDNRVYKIEVVAQPKPPYDPLPIVSIVINGIIALAAFGTLCVLWKQTKATEIAAFAARDSAEHQRKAMIFDQRAWVGPTGIAMKKFVVGQKVDALVETINSGKSPALKLVALIGFVPLSQPISEIIEPPDDIEGSETVCFPNQKYTVHAYSTAPLSQAEFGAIHANQLFFYIVGRLTHTDIFGDPHTTRIAAVYDPVVKGFHATPIGNTTD
jgi:hypothetical protein